jgi:WD40 repeat protein
MSSTGKTFRIFVSSTFSDLKEERNALQRYVFPRLRDLCMQSGCRFQAIDLRWGMSEEAGRDQQTMKICLEEIARCQETTVRPNFIVLLGDRYGWCPLPYEIPKIEFDPIIEKVTDDRDKELITQWYRCDENAVPPVYCLKEREVIIAKDATDDQKKAAQEKESEEWRKTEKELRLIFLRAIDQLGWQEDDSRRVKYEASATEQEINQGALKPQDAQKHVFCFFRTIIGLPEDISARDFCDIDNDGNPDNTAKSQLNNLKTRLSEQLPGNVLEYNANWTDKGSSTDHIGSLPDKLENCLKLNDSGTITSSLCGDVWKKLSKVIMDEIAQFKYVDALENEIENHEDFGKERTRFFVGRTSILQKISDYAKGIDPHPLAVFGVSGSGKSALMACAVGQVRSEYKNAEVIVRYIGATPESSDGRTLLESLCRQIFIVFNFEEQKRERLDKIVGFDEEAENMRRQVEEEYSIPLDFQNLSTTFKNFLVKIPTTKKLVLFLDALDQLSNTDNANSLTWIPREMPQHVHLVVSTLHGEEKKVPSSIQIELEKMLHKDGNELLYLWMKDAKRSLQETQKKEVLNKFEKSGLPLYLKLAFEEARRWKSYEGIPLGSNGKQGLSEDVPGIIRDMFSRLSSESNHGKMLVSRSMGYLAASKNGLTEDEMLDVLSMDDELYQDFLIRARHIPSEKKLPVVIWSRLYFDLEPYLTERSADRTSLMAFFHRQLGEVVFEDYLKDGEKKERHRILANYFGKKPYWAKIAKIRSPNIRKTSELPYQQAHAGMDELVDTMTDFKFMDAKLHALEISSLINDYDLAYIPDVGEKVKHSENSLRLIQGGLRLSAHILTDKEQLRSQLAGRLLSFQEPEIRSLLEGVCEWKDEMWLRPMTASLTPPGGSLILTMKGHTGWVMAVSVTPDGRRAISASRDGTLKMWDMESGGEIHTLKGHTLGVIVVSVTPDGRRAISASEDTTLKVWDMESGSEIRTLEGHYIWFEGVYDGFMAVYVTPDGRRAISVRKDETTLEVWDMENGIKIRTLERHNNYRINAVSMTPDGRRAISASDDKTLKVWDMESGGEIRTLKGHTNSVRAVSVTTDGRRIISASDDKTLKIWDMESGSEIRTLKGHTRPVNLVSVTPDGRRAISASEDTTLKVWDMESGSEIRTLEGHTDRVVAVSVTPDGRRVISASDDNTLKVWDMETGVEIRTLEGHTNSVRALSVTPDGRRAISASYDNTLKVWDMESGRIIAGFSGDGSLCSCAIAPDGKTIAAGDKSGSVHFLRLENVVHNTPIATAWQLPDQLPGFSCPICRTWSEIPAYALGTEIPCPHCSKAIKLNPFTINADWRPVAKAWGMKDIPGEKEISDRSKVNTSIQKTEETEAINTEKVKEKIKKPWWKLW